MRVYEQVYEYYVKQMEEGTLASGSRMPSLRETEKMLHVSRTSVETAYLQLMADGYIYSVEKVGYFVSDMMPQAASVKAEPEDGMVQTPVRYNLAAIGEDRRCSCLELWRRYMKSALRQEERLLSYAANRGEEELRREIASYVRKQRNIICSPEDIVIGAGFQSLLMILMAMVDGEKSVSFPTNDFGDGAAVFRNGGYDVRFRDKSCHIIYVTPSYMTKWGDVMSMNRRYELVVHAKEGGHLIIEDDYQNEFVFSQTPTPSLYVMSGGEQVAFLGSFSRILLPSVRISYLILPKGYRKRYEKVMHLYNQTASKAEQIALAQFLRDGHLRGHVRKNARLYENKRKVFRSLLLEAFDGRAEILFGKSGMEAELVFPREDEVVKRLQEAEIAVEVLQETKTETKLLLSCSILPEEELQQAVYAMKQAIYGAASKPSRV